MKVTLTGWPVVDDNGQPLGGPDETVEVDDDRGRRLIADGHARHPDQVSKVASDDLDAALTTAGIDPTEHSTVKAKRDALKSAQQGG